MTEESFEKMTRVNERLEKHADRFIDCAAVAQEPSNLVHLSGTYSLAPFLSSSLGENSRTSVTASRNLALNTSIRPKLRAEYTSVKCSQI